MSDDPQENKEEEDAGENKDGEGDAEEGEQKEMTEVEKMMAQHAIDNAESEEEFVPLEIRQKIMDFYAE